jgi:RNA-directed DNA polymerase
MGWSTYYGMTQYPSQLKGIEAHIRRRLRSRIIDKRKSRRNLFHKLQKRGVSQRKAALASFNNKKRWAISHMSAVERAYSNNWFISEMGLHIRSNEKRDDWFDIKQWVRLT